MIVFPELPSHPQRKWVETIHVHVAAVRNIKTAVAENNRRGYLTAELFRQFMKLTEINCCHNL